MNHKYKNKYLTTSHRRPNWDYSADALYFLTIVTQNRVCNLGQINHNHLSDGMPEMILSDFGEIVKEEWFKSFEIRDELLLHDFVMMPNHLHAIVEIYNKNRGDDLMKTSHVPVGTHTIVETPTTTTVETHGRASLHAHAESSHVDSIYDGSSQINIKRNPPIRLPKSISSFMAGFKSAVNTKIDDYIDEKRLDIPKYNRNNHFFQPNYYDHIVRNQQEYLNISNYIVNNPLNWGEDKFYVESKSQV